MPQSLPFLTGSNEQQNGDDELGSVSGAQFDG
jgi:hypothetical protein